MNHPSVGGAAGYVLELRCSTCSGHPIIEVYRNVDPHSSLGSTDTDKCLRCQGRVLDRPHPSDHLCGLCRVECADCRAPITSGEQLQGGICRRCRGMCPICNTVMNGGTCEECARTTQRDPLATVMRAFPVALIGLCEGQFHSDVVTTARVEIERVGHHRVVERILRRWWKFWAHLPLAKDREGVHTPDQCAYSLIAPHGCDLVDCEDGWLLEADRNCHACNLPQHDGTAGLFRPVHLVLADAGAQAVRADPRHAQLRAQEIRRELHWTHGVSRSNRSSLRRAEEKAFTPYTPAPYTLREQPTLWPPREPGAGDSPILAAREEGRSDVYEAAVQRARREKAIRKNQLPRPSDPPAWGQKAP